MRHRLECIAIPIVATEINKLELLMRLWRKHFVNTPPKSARDISLIISVSCKYCDSLHVSISAIMSSHQMHHTFRSVDIIFLDIPKEEDIYVRAGNKIPALTPRLGLKNGPNAQFFETMRHCTPYNTTLLSETDLYPIADDWLDRTHEAVKLANHFLILGSYYKGTHSIPHYFLQHINGNACYATGHSGFCNGLLPLWEGSLAEISKNINPDVAYDTWLSYATWLYLFGDLKDEANIRHEICRYSYLARGSDLFWNAPLPNDNLSQDKIRSLRDIGTLFLHGRIHEAEIVALYL